MLFAAKVYIVAFTLANQGAAHAEDNGTPTCIQSPLHKRSPSPEVNIREGTACSRYANLSCCTANTSHSIDQQGERELYDFHWDDCGVIPTACEKYLKAESCFFGCDPYLGPWKGQNETVEYVPICGSYCDQWFDACKSVPICAANWITDFVKNSTTGRYHCLNGTCLTFAQWYGNGKVMCETMWDTFLRYDADNDNCMVMMFTGNNPNANVTSGATHIVWCQHGLFLLYAVLSMIFLSTDYI